MTPATALTWTCRGVAVCVVAMIVSLANSAWDGNWPMLAISAPLYAVILGCDAIFISALRAKAHQQAVAPTRTPAFPGGKDCPPGCCPICGMEDPDYLEAWGHLQAHRACAELEGEPPPKPKERRPEGQPAKGKDVNIQDGEHPCRHDRTQAVERWGAPTLRVCLDCGRGVGSRV